MTPAVAGAGSPRGVPDMSFMNQHRWGRGLLMVFYAPGSPPKAREQVFVSNFVRNLNV